jgi:hypothetical protein
VLKEVTKEIYHMLHPKMAFFLARISPPRAGGKPNVMACAWATPVSDEPPLAVVCVSKES